MACTNNYCKTFPSPKRVAPPRRKKSVTKGDPSPRDAPAPALFVVSQSHVPDIFASGTAAEAFMSADQLLGSTHVVEMQRRGAAYVATAEFESPKRRAAKKARATADALQEKRATAAANKTQKAHETVRKAEAKLVAFAATPAGVKKGMFTIQAGFFRDLFAIAIGPTTTLLDIKTRAEAAGYVSHVRCMSHMQLVCSPTKPSKPIMLYLDETRPLKALGARQGSTLIQKCG
jgi:hypothetical protein